MKLTTIFLLIVEQRLSKLEVSNCQINTKLDKILEILKHGHNTENHQAAPDILKSFPFPLTKVEQVEKLESKLLDEEYKKKIVM